MPQTNRLSPKGNSYKKWIRIVLFVALCIVVYGIVPQIDSLKPSISTIKSADTFKVIAAIFISLLAYCITAMIYTVLSPKKLRYFRTLLVQIASASVNRVIPAGFGGMGVNIAYLHSEKMSISQSMATATLNNVSGIVGHILLLIVTFVILGSQSSQLSAKNALLVLMVVMAFGVILAGLVFFSPKIRKQIKQLAKDLASYRNHKRKLIAAVSLSLVITLCNSLCIWLCCSAIGLDISLTAALIVLTGGVGAGAAVPTPGAVGAFEAGMYAALLTFETNPALAFAAVLLYRLITYWLPLIIGSLALIYCQKKRYFGFSF